MRHTTDIVEIGGGGQLFCHTWNAEDRRAIVLVAHGYAEHGGRYGAFAERLTDAGFVVVACDHRGCGQSSGKQGYISRFDQYIEDFDVVIQKTQERFAKLPLFLFGHSMGALIVALYVIEKQPVVAGVVLSSSAARIPEAKLLQSLSVVVSVLLPRLPTVTMDRDLISRDAQVVRRAREDQLCFQGPVYARMGAEMIRAGRRARRNAHRIRVPLLALHGTADRLTLPEGSQELFDNVSSKDKHLIFYDGLYHETFNEPEKDEVYGDVIEWVHRHSRPRPN